MLNVTKLSAGYGGGKVLKDVSFTAESGEVTVILGPNGCGKSTLLKSLCGILPADGEAKLGEENLLQLPPKELAKRAAYLAQSRQIPDITAERMVLHGRFPYLSYPRRYRPQDIAAAKSAMERMGIADLAEKPLAQLSGGQRQKVYIAMALAQDTPLVLLDEPTTFLDISQQFQMMEHARFLCQQGKTVVMVLHDITLAMEVAEKLVVMDEGTVVKEGSVEEIFADGCIGRVFGVKLQRLKTEGGWHYFCERMA